MLPDWGFNIVLPTIAICIGLIFIGSLLLFNLRPGECLAYKDLEKQFGCFRADDATDAKSFTYIAGSICEILITLFFTYLFGKPLYKLLAKPRQDSHLEIPLSVINKFKTSFDHGDNDSKYDIDINYSEKNEGSTSSHPNGFLHPVTPSLVNSDSASKSTESGSPNTSTVPHSPNTQDTQGSKTPVLKSNTSDLPQISESKVLPAHSNNNYGKQLHSPVFTANGNLSAEDSTSRNSNDDGQESKRDSVSISQDHKRVRETIHNIVRLATTHGKSKQDERIRISLLYNVIFSIINLISSNFLVVGFGLNREMFYFAPYIDYTLNPLTTFLMLGRNRTYVKKLLFQFRLFVYNLFCDYDCCCQNGHESETNLSDLNVVANQTTKTSENKTDDGLQTVKTDNDVDGKDKTSSFNPQPLTRSRGRSAVHKAKLQQSVRNLDDLLREGSVNLPDYNIES